MFDRPFFVTDFPVSGETYFHKSNPAKPELSLCADLLAPEGYGEISSAGETITDKKELLKKLKETQIEPSRPPMVLKSKTVRLCSKIWVCSRCRALSTVDMQARKCERSHILSQNLRTNLPLIFVFFSNFFSGFNVHFQSYSFQKI